MSTKIYTSRFAAKRAMKKMADADSLTVNCYGSKEYRIEPKSVAAPARPKKERKAKKEKKAAAERPLGKRAAILAAAQTGKLPSPPDFSAKTHTSFRPKLAELVKLAKEGDVKGLKAYKINPISTSPKAMARYRDLAVIALEAKA